jgi:hypothetical protein
MDTKYLGRDDGGDREAIKDIDEGFPRLDITSSLAFVIKPIYCVQCKY